MQHTYSPTKHSGFTLVEMLVVAPLVILVIATAIGFLLSLVGGVLMANTRTQDVYDIQDALTRIEQDTFYSAGFLATYAPSTPQGKDNGTGSFNSTSGTNTDMIFNQPATDKNPADSARQLVYLANQPEPCAGQVQMNTVLYAKAIYYLKTVGTVQSLYRRVIVPTSQTTCTQPWQRNSCTSINYGGYTAICVSKDEKLVDNVTALTVTYYNKIAPATSISDPKLADSLKVSITTSKKATGETITSTLDVAASRTNR